MDYIFGLGNPGLKYKNTRHNAGFCVVDILAKKHGIKLKSEKKFDAMVGEGTIEGKRVMLVKPDTFMNNSGYAVSAVVDYYKADLSQIIVVYDDIDIPLGSLRIREKGSAGTHNGMRSIISYLSENEFRRVRVGIGGPSHSLTAHVLGKFEDMEKAKEMFLNAASACECLVLEGVQSAQQQFREKNV